MTKIDYEKIANKLLREQPYNIEAFEKLKEYGYILPFSTIMSHDYGWLRQEKQQLLRIFGYNKYEQIEKIEDKNGTISYIKVIKKYIMEKDYENYEVLISMLEEMKIFCNPSGSIEALLIEILEWLNVYNRSQQYYDSLLESISEELIQKITADNFVIENGRHFINQSAIGLFIKSKNSLVIEKIKKYIKDINLHFNEAICTDDQDIVQSFIDDGADINYIHPNPLFGLCPLKTAIKNDCYNSFNALMENGADANSISIEPNLKDIIIKKNPTINKEQLKDEDIKNIEFERTSRPIDYAISFVCDHKNDNNDGTNMIYKIYNNLNYEEKETIDYTNLIIACMMYEEGLYLEQYVSDIIRSEIKVDCTKIVKYLITKCKYRHLGIFEEIKRLYESQNPPKAFINDILKEYSSTTNLMSFEELINQLSDEEKKKIIIAPKITSAKGFEDLLYFGFDINQQNEYGNTLLHELFYNPYVGDTDTKYLKDIIDKIDLSKTNKLGKTVLNVALENMPLWCDYEFARTENPKISVDEEIIVYLINKMKKEDVTSVLTTVSLQYRFGLLPKNDDPKCISDGDFFAPAFYHVHKDLFTALLDKCLLLGKDIFNKLLEGVSLGKEDEFDRIDYDKSEEFLFEKADCNTVIQKFNIDEKVTGIIKKINNAQSSQDFEIIKKDLQNINEFITSYKKFAVEVIPKKYNPKEYKKYAKKKYGIDYDNLEYIFFKIFASIILKTKNSDLIIELINICDNFNKDYFGELEIEIDTSILYNMLYGISGVNSDGDPIVRDGFIEPQITFDSTIFVTGTLVQVAELANNLDLIKKFHENGVPLTANKKGEDYTWCYINSEEVKEYVEKSLGIHTLGELQNKEVDIYLNLINRNKE